PKETVAARVSAGTFQDAATTCPRAEAAGEAEAAEAEAAEAAACCFRREPSPTDWARSEPLVAWSPACSAAAWWRPAAASPPACSAAGWWLRQVGADYRAFPSISRWG